MARRPDPEPPLDDAEIEELQALLDTVPRPLEPLDVSALDGYLAGVVLQPALAVQQWLPMVTDVEGRALPSGFDATRLHALARRRHRELDSAVARRQWFDPWVVELDPAEPPSQALIGWVAGFAAALQRFPALLESGGDALTEPLALLYRHLRGAASGGGASATRLPRRAPERPKQGRRPPPRPVSRASRPSCRRRAARHRSL
jgi:uncharacterized protein